MANNNAYDELNKLINDIVATGRVESSSGKAQQGSSGSGQSAGGQSSVQVGTPEYFAQRRSALGITNRTIDSNYIGKFIADANKFSRDGVSANVRMGYRTSKNIYNERKSQADELRSRSFAIDRFLDQNKDSIDQKTYEDLKGYIKSFGEYSANSMYSMYRTNQFYSQFKDEADYNKYVAEQERYQKLSTMDLRQAEEEIRKLESDRDNFIWNTEYDASDHNQRVQFQNALRQQEAEISQRRAELRQAKNIQEGITLSNASNNEDFSQYSGYRSTKQDGFLNRITSDLQLGYRDLQYEYINNQNGIRDEIDTLAMANGQAGNHQYRQKGYDQLKPDEVAIYNYYYAKEGSKKAQQYLDNLQETLNHRMATGMYEPIEDKLALELAFGVAAGIDQFASGVKSFLNTDDDYIAPSAYQMASAMVREDLADVGKKLPDWLGGGSVGQGAYDAVTTISNMAPSIAGSTIASVLAPGIGLPAAISKYAGAAVGNGLMFASSAGNAYQEALNSGFDKGQARAYSTLVGASEAGLQYLLGGITSMGGVISGGVTEQILKGVDNALARTAIQIGGNMISEGVEEGLQEILTPWFKNLTLHVNEDVNWNEVAYSTLLGALTAGIMEGPSTAGQEINTYRSGKKLMGMDGGAERIAQIGNTFAADTVAYKLAGKVNEKTGAYTIGRLFNEIDATITEQNKNDITRALMDEGMTKEIASKNAEVLQFIADGGQVSDIQMRMIEKNEVLAKVAREVLIDENSTYNQRMRGYNEAVNQLKPQNKKSQHTNQENRNQAAQEEHGAAEEAVDMQADEVSIEGKDIRKSDSSAINIEGISEIKNGEVTLRLDDGSTINSKDVSFASEMDAVVYNTLSSMDISTRAGQILLDGYNTAKQNGNLSAGEYALGISEAFRYGQQGIPYKEISRSPFASKLNIGQQEFLYKQGMRAAGKVAAKKQAEASKYRGTETGKRKGTVHSDIDIKTLNQRQQASIAGLKAVADAIGVDFYLFESKVVGGKRRGANGWYDPKDSSIHIDIYAGQNGEGTILFTASHELTHFIRQWSPAKFKTLANFVLKQYGDNGVSVSELIAKQISKAAENGRTIDSDTAYEEVVADSMESMLADPDFMERIAELKKQDRSLVEKIHDFLKDFASKIRAAYEGLNPDSEEGRIVSEMADSIETIRDMFAEALVDAGENYSSSLMPGEDSVVVDDSGDPVAMSTEDGSVVLSLRTYEESGRTELRKYLEKCVSINKLTKADMQEMLDGIEEIYKVCSQFKDKYAPFGRWSDAAVVRDTYGRPVFSVVTPNGEYKMNLDFSLVCKKRRTLDAVFNEMSRRGIIDDFELGQKSVVKINEIIRRYGLETACALCFVDAKRFRQAAMADSFTGLYNELVYSLVPEDQRGSIDHFNFSGNEKVKKVEGGIDTWDSSRLDFTHLNEVMQNYEKGTVEYKAAKYIKTHAEGRKLLMRGDFMSSSGFDTVKSKNKDILKLYNAKKGTGGPKAAFGDVQYLNEIIKKARTWTPEKAYAVGGVRIQSFSDYVPRMVFDYTQMIYDLAATKLPAHAYTKEAMFAMQFGLTGVKINMSLIPAVVDGGIAPGLDANGNYVWAGESFDYEIAKKIQNADGYTENCGTICVGVSYQHILKLLGDPDIRMIIPYHKSGLNPIVAHMNKIAEFTDYTSLKTNPGGCQNTMDKNGSKVEKDFSFNESLIKTGDPKATAREYLNWCAEHGYTPRFAEFAWHENYYKLLEDFTLYDKDGNYVPQREVRAVFPKAENAFGSMKDLIQAGLEEDAVIEGKRDRSLGAIVDEIQKILPRTEAEIEEKQVAQADRDLEAAIRGIEEDVHTDDVNAIQEQISDVVNTLKFSDRGASKRTETYSAIGKELLTYEEGNRKPDLTLVQVVNDRTGKTETTIKHFGQKPKDYIPKKIAYCYKLFEQHPDGTLHALFAGAKGETPIGVWQYAQGFPYTDSGVKGMNLRERYGWHLSAGLPAAPHLMSPKDFSRGYPSKNAYGHPKGSKRVWVRMAYDATTDFNAIADSTKSGDIFGLIPFGGYYAFKENNQSEWVISSAVKIDKILTEEERQEILRNAGYNEYEEWRKKHHATDAEKAESKRRSSENKKAKDLAAKEGKNYLSESAKEMREAIKSRIIDNPELSENNDIHYSDRNNAPTFYSYMAKVVDGVKQEKLGAASVVNMLRGKGVKAEEIRWSGIEAWLDGKKSVTKSELQEFITGSILQIEEKTLTNDEIPYTYDQKKRIAEKESKRNEIVNRLADEWKRITNTEFPIHNTGSGLESAVASKILDINMDHKKASPVGRMLDNLRKEVKEVIANNDDFGFDSGREALIYLNRYRMKFVEGYEMEKADEEVISRYCNALNSIKEMPNLISYAETEKLRGIAKEADMVSSDIGEIHAEHYAEAAKKMPKWESHKLRGGENYREIIFRMPDSDYTNDAMNMHWEGTTGVLAHARIQDMTTSNGISMLFIEEIQSDWHNEGRKNGYRNVPDAPFRDTYHEYVLKRLIRMAAEQGYDSIGWTTADIQRKRWSDEYTEGYRIEYDQEIPKFLSKYGKKWGSKVGKTVLDSGTEVWSMDITDSMKESVLTEGQPLYQDRRNGGLSNRTLLANALETAAQNDIERKRLAEYKESIELINGEEQKLRTIRKQIKSATDPDTVKELYAEAAKVANRISVYDGKLLRLEASKPLKDLLSREQKAAYDRGVKQGKAALDAYKDRMEKNQQELVDRYRDARKRSIDDRQKAEIKQKIRKTIRDLDGILNRGSKKRNVKEGMKGLVDTAIKSAEILFTDSYTNEDLIRNGIETQMTPEELKLLNEARAIMDELDNLPTGYDGYLARKEKEDALRGRLSYRMGKLKDVFVRERARLNQTTVSSVLGELADAYGSMQSSELPHIQGAYHENVHEYLKMLQEDIGGTIIKDMTRDQLEELYKAYTMVKTTVFNANRMFAENLNNTRDALASMVMDEVKKVGGIHGPWSKAENSVNTFVWNNEKPVYAFERIGSNTLSAMYANIRKGQDTWAVDLQEANDFRKEMYRKFNRKGWDLLKGYKFTSSTGLEFELNLDQIMSLYAYSKRAQAHDHLLKGGFVFDGSTETIINKHGVNLKYLVKDATAYNLSYEILENIISNLTPEQKAFVDAMQDYLSTTMGQKGNDVSMKLYGVKLFNEKFYFPLRSAGQYMERAKEADMKKQQGQISISNSGFSKAVKEKASNPVVLSGFMDVWASHVNEMSMYHSFVLPMEDFRRVWNYSSPHEEGTQSASVNGVVENAYGKAAVEYIDRLYRDLNGGAITDNTAGVINKMMNLFKKGAVFASASVTIQQPSAIARATALIDPKYFVGEKISAGKHSEVWAEVKKYAPVAIIKEMGFFDTNMGRSATDFLTSEEYTGIKEKAEAIVKDGDYRDEMLSKAPALADELTWCVIWNAVKRETKARNPGMDIRSDAFLQECGERFSEVIDKTQVYDSVLARSANMRSKDTGMKMATAFMAEPTTSINMIEDALRKAKRGDKKYARRAIGSVVASMILNSFLVSWVYAARDDDDEKSFMEKYVNQFVAGIVDGINPMTYIPFLKDIVSIVQGYEVERSDMSVISDLWNAIQKLKRDDVSTYRKVEDFAGSICQIFGLPVKNIMRDVRSAYQAWDTVAHGEKTTKAGLVYAAKEDLPLVGGKVSNMDQLYEARKAGDTEHAARVEERYIRKNDGDREEGMKSANAAVRTSIKNRYMEGKLDGSQAYTELLMIANEDPKNISWLIDEWNYKRETGKDDYNKFNAFYEAVRTGKNLKATIQTYTERDVEWATLKRQMTSKFKPEYLEMSASERAGIKGYLINALTQLGTTREDAENTLRDWDFEAKYGMTYSDMKKGFEEGTIDQSTMESGMKDMGMKNYEIAEQMRKMTDGNSFFKKYGSSKSEYKKSYLEGRISREQYIDSLVYDGKTEAEAEEAVRTLDIEKRFGIEYGKLDDAYKYGDISREDLKGAIIENGETPEKAEQAVQCYDWLKERVYEHPDLEIADARRFVINIGQYSDKTLTDYGVSVEAYKQYTILKRDVHGVDANNDGKTDSGTYRDALFEMIDELPISSEAKTGLALISYSEKTIRRKAPWR